MSVHRRRGSAVIEYLHQLEFAPAALYMVGVGVTCDEADAFHSCWPDASIFGWEPNPHSRQGLTKFPGVLYPEAIGSEERIVDLHYRMSWKNGSSVHKPVGRGRNRTEPVKIVRLDSVVTPVSKSVLWLDCEGSELEALRGAETLIKSVSVVNVELTGKPRTENWCKPIEVHEWLVEHGFTQSYVHSIRTVINQFDSVYLDQETFRPEMCSCLGSL